MNRKHFLKSIVGAASFLSLPLGTKANTNDLLKQLETPNYHPKGTATQLNSEPIQKVRVGIIGVGNRGTVLLKMFKWLIENNHAEIVAIADTNTSKTNRAMDQLKSMQQKAPTAYSKSENDWKNLVDRDDIDLVLIATPWKWHTPMALYSMQKGKHVAVEVPIALTLEDCYKIVETAEQTQKHCIMLENCCYNDEELFVLNMVENGVFGDLTHAECAYIHDLRAHMLSESYYENQWRIKHHVERNGNFYTTHGIGPVSMYMDIGRGDTFSHLTSMSSKEASLSQTAKQKNSPYTTIACGDVNTSLIQTYSGKSIMLQFDVHTGRPYSRINKLVGTKACHDGYPSRLYIDKDELKFWGHQWLDEHEYNQYKELYQHPLIHKLQNISKEYKEGHGGMDFVMIYRLIRCLNLGLSLDFNVYDGVLWSALTPLSELSVSLNSQSVTIPDFTGGTWKEKRKHEIMRAELE